MVNITEYTAEYDRAHSAYRIICKQHCTCPQCGGRLSGYDTRRRHVIDAAGEVHWVLLPRLRCSGCRRLHTAAPAFIQPHKYYEAAVIAAALEGHCGCCPADDSTIRRWGR